MKALDNSSVKDATIFHNGQSARSDAQGRFRLSAGNLEKPVLIKAPGYKRLSTKLQKFIRTDAILESFSAKALYLSQAGVGAPALRDPVFRRLGENGLNSLVVDAKSDRGLFSFVWEIPLAHKIGAMGKFSIDDPDAFVRDLRKKDIYLIARVSVFKDDALARQKPEWAVIDTRTGKPYTENQIAWVDPFQEQTWGYSLEIAKAAAELGFDEILFDNVRFPFVATNIIKLAKENTETNRVAAVNGFLQRAVTELQPYNVFVSSTVSASALWSKTDGRLGQKLEDIAKTVDYVCPFVYPSGLAGIIPGSKTNAVLFPKQTVLKAVKQTISRIGGDPKRVRPWLQNFKDFAIDRREFEKEQIAEQIIACDEAGTSGWMLFDPTNVYKHSSGALRLVEQGSSETNNVEQAKQ